MIKNKISNGFKILIAGEGGQGVQTISKILTETAYHKGLEVSFVPNYGVEQRGGVSLGYIKFGKDQINYPKFIIADIAIFLSERSVARSEDYVNQNSIIIYNKDFVKKSPKNAKGYAFDSLANEMGNNRVMNMLVLGVIAQYIKNILSLEDIKAEVNKKLAHKYKQYPKLKKMNIEALEKGYNL
ncbi:2-oxoacid:acceptor oxidoreductase family protein [bacterium]|nr:2-oxoacid:acceptor oxidoreductase family protein [bacterium]